MSLLELFKTGFKSTIEFVRKERFFSFLIFLCAGGFYFFAKLASEILEGEGRAVDKAVLLWLRDPSNPHELLGPPWLHEMMRDLTALGGIGLVFDAEGYTFTCAAVKKAGKRYKYYVSTQAVKKSYDDCPIKTLSAPLLEGVIIEQMRRILTRPEWSKSVIGKVKELLNDGSPDDTKIVQTLQNFDLLWDELFPLEQQRLAKLIIQKVVIYPEKVIIALRPLGMAGLLHEMMPDAKMKKGQPTENTPLEITIPIKLKKHGGRKYITTPDGRDLSVARRPKYENNMIRAIVRGHQFSDMLEKEPNITIQQLAEREMLDHGYIAKTIRMTQLAPDIIEAILNGRQPYSLNLTDFMKPFPNSWEEQRQHFGFSENA